MAPALVSSIDYWLNAVEFLLILMKCVLFSRGLRHQFSSRQLIALSTIQLSKKPTVSFWYGPSKFKITCFFVAKLTLNRKIPRSMSSWPEEKAILKKRTNEKGIKLKIAMIKVDLLTCKWKFLTLRSKWKQI